MIEVKVEVAKHKTSTRANPTSLGRYNHIDVVNGEKMRITSRCK